jgi:hypothetical protein
VARGWESKSVESQIGEREARLESEAYPPVTAANRERENLTLTRKRVLRDLWNAKHPQHREQLLAALKHLDEKLAGLSRP